LTAVNFFALTLKIDFLQIHQFTLKDIRLPFPYVKFNKRFRMHKLALLGVRYFVAAFQPANIAPAFRV
jgi:hypothetical protein